MPSPRSGTVVENLRPAIQEVKGGGLLEYRAEGMGEVVVTIGDTSFAQKKILENMLHLKNYKKRKWQVQNNIL